MTPPSSEMAASPPPPPPMCHATTTQRAGPVLDRAEKVPPTSSGSVGMTSVSVAPAPHHHRHMGVTFAVTAAPAPCNSQEEVGGGRRRPPWPQLHEFLDHAGGEGVWPQPAEVAFTKTGVGVVGVGGGGFIFRAHLGFPECSRRFLPRPPPSSILQWEHLLHLLRPNPP